jgi:hypothetical protein
MTGQVPPLKPLIGPSLLVRHSTILILSNSRPCLVPCVPAEVAEWLFRTGKVSVGLGEGSHDWLTERRRVSYGTLILFAAKVVSFLREYGGVNFLLVCQNSLVLDYSDIEKYIKSGRQPMLSQDFSIHFKSNFKLLLRYLLVILLLL